MLLNSGNPSLHSQIRLYVNDPSGTPNERFTDQQVTDMANVEYLELRDLVSVPGSGQARKIGYANGTAASSPSDMLYALPADYVRDLRVTISTEGKDLSTTMPADDPATRVLDPAHYDEAMDFFYASGGTESARYVFISDTNYGISPPLTATEAGTNSIRLDYVASTTLLSSNTDEPSIPRPHHDLICLGAAMKLLIAHGLPANDVASLYQQKLAAFRRSVWSQLSSHNLQMSVAGRPPRNRRTKFGTTKKI